MIREKTKQQSKLFFSGFHNLYTNQNRYTFKQKEVFMEKQIYLGCEVIKLNKFIKYETNYDKL